MIIMKTEYIIKFCAQMLGMGFDITKEGTFKYHAGSLAWERKTTVTVKEDGLAHISHYEMWCDEDMEPHYKTAEHDTVLPFVAQVLSQYGYHSRR